MFEYVLRANDPDQTQVEGSKHNTDAQRMAILKYQSTPMDCVSSPRPSMLLLDLVEDLPDEHSPPAVRSFNIRFQRHVLVETTNAAVAFSMSCSVVVESARR